MSINVNDFRIAIRIDNAEAKTKFNETREQIARVREEMQKLEAGGKKDSAEYKERKTQLDKLNTSYAEQRKEVGRTALSYDELRKGARSLKAQLDRAVPETEKWKELRADFLLTKQRMKELEGQGRETRLSLSKVADGFNKYAAIGASAIASLTGVALTARKCVDEYAEMEEAESQVRKYTGMTREEIKLLNDEFKQMDTRTARTELNRLAGEAGKLGITGKDDVLEFVDAANMINVALGEDLGEDAVKNIGKLAQMFGESDKLGLRGAMLATGSAVNEVAQNSSAAEAYLVGFMGRVSGAANQAKIAQGDIIGYASVLDQNMQQQEMAATAFQTLMMKMYQEPAKFAKMAGKNVAEFTSLIKNDANEAILLFLDSLNKKGGLDKLAPMFKEMGLDGVRASGVISTMAGKIDDIRSAQKLANDAYRDGTSIINEYNVQNTTVQAELEKAKKRFTDIRVELGEKLLPVMKHMITTGSMTVKGLSAIVSILGEYKGAIITVSLSIATYTLAVKAHSLWTTKLKTETGQLIIMQKLSNTWNRICAAGNTLLSATMYTLKGNTTMAKESMLGFFRILKMHPFAFITTAIVGITAALLLFSRRVSEAERSQSLLNDVMNDAKGNILAERTEVESLLKVAKNETVSKEARLRAIKKLNNISPEYLGSLKLETIATDKAKDAIDRYVNSLLSLAEIESVKSRLTDTDKQLDELKKKHKEYLEERSSFWGALKAAPKNVGSMLTFGAVESTGQNLKNDLLELEQQKEQLKKLLEGLIKDKTEIESKASIRSVDNVATELATAQKRLSELLNMSLFEREHLDYDYDQLVNDVRDKVKKLQAELKLLSTNDTGGMDGDESKKPWIARLQVAENAYKEELLLLRKNSDTLARTENEYRLDALQKEMEYQGKRLAIIKHYQSVDGDKKHLAELGKLESESKASFYNSLKESENTRLGLLQEYRDRRINTVTEGEKKLQLEQSKLYESGDLLEKDYKNRLLAIEISSLFSRLEIAKDYQNDVSELEFQNGEIKAKAVKEAGNNVLDLERKISEKRAAIAQSSINQIQSFNNQFGKTNSLATVDQQLAALKTFYNSQMELAKKNGIDTTLLTAVYEEARRKIVEKGAEERADVIRKYGLSAAEDTKNLKLQALEEEHKKGLLSEEEYEIAKSKIFNEYLQDKISATGQYFEAISQIMGNVSSAIQGFQDAEINQVTRKYDKEIKVAKKAGKDTTKLEEQKEEAINQVKKKYADKQFAAAVLQVTASTAVAAMEAYKAMAGIPYVGPVLGGIAAAAALASGAAQIEVAKQQRDEAKGLKEGGYSDEYVKGYTRNGNPDDVAGVIPVHKNEFVANHEGVANPHVRQFLDVFDVAQKNGTIRMINTTQILEQVRTRSGKYSGGYVNDKSVPVSFIGNSSGIGDLSPEERKQVVILLQENNRLLGILCDKELIVDPRKVRDGIRKIDLLERNVSR